MPATVEYRRDQVTWTGFSLIGVWAYFLYFVGPGSTAIGADLELSGTATGFIGTALAIGLTTSAVAGPWAVRRWGRRRTLQRLLVGMAVLAVLLAASGTYPMVLAAVACLGLVGATIANTSTAMLSDHHGAHRARAITEGNAAASWLGVIAPAVLGFCLALPTGWRGAAVIVAALPLAALLLVARLPRHEQHSPVPVVPRVPRSAPARVPPVFWPALVAVGMAVALEFSVNFWAAALITQRAGVDLSAAATALSAMTFGMALGRTFAASLPNRYPTTILLVGFFLIAAVGLAALLQSPSYWLSVGALLITGLGLSVLFPFAQSLAISLVLDGTDRAVALTAVAVGMAIGGAPFLLGVIANQAGLEAAFSVGFVLAAVGISATVAVAVLQRRSPPWTRR